MKITKASSKCAAFLCAAAIMMPVAGAVPATFSVNDTATALAASADSAAGLTGDQYCKVGDTFTFEVTLYDDYKDSYNSSDFTYQWYYSDTQSGTLNWTKISGATSAKYSDTMTSSKNLRHFKVQITNTKTGESHDTDWYPIRTVTCNAVTTKLGAASVVNNSSGTWIKIPVTLSGLYNQKLTGYYFVINLSSGVFEDAVFDDLSGIGSMDNFSASDNQYVVMGYGIAPVTISSNNPLGYFMLKVKNGANADGAKLSISDLKFSATGDGLAGDIEYGVAPVNYTVSLSSSSTNNVPVIRNIDYNTQFHQFRLIWNAVPNAQAYGIAYYSAGKWRVYTQSIAPSTTYWTSPKLTAGRSYKVAVAAKVGGTWDTTGAVKNAITVTVK